MDTFVIVKQPGKPAELVGAPEQLELAFLQQHVGGYIELFPRKGHISELLDKVTIVMDEDGVSKELADNLRFPFATVVGPVLVCLTNEEGQEHGLCLEHAEAVARALDHYGVGMPSLPN